MCSPLDEFTATSWGNDKLRMFLVVQDNAAGRSSFQMERKRITRWHSWRASLAREVASVTPAEASTVIDEPPQAPRRRASLTEDESMSLKELQEKECIGSESSCLLCTSARLSPERKPHGKSKTYSAMSA
ncbi:expressed unknown protein [Seminavis robusta]|uniref:Uncharacterized protein n=1 Tax=Seminavis robusta TaxID=568900 RepID=A0A9N8HC79_9STRA|nr:expressed unknown protein [Seminavis robusta]|eukprot:Sro369_g128210.1 n/a (130) ;mRNA; r:40845-41234